MSGWVLANSEQCTPLLLREFVHIFVHICSEAIHVRMHVCSNVFSRDKKIETKQCCSSVIIKSINRDKQHVAHTIMPSSDTESKHFRMHSGYGSSARTPLLQVHENCVHYKSLSERTYLARYWIILYCTRFMQEQVV